MELARYVHKMKYRLMKVECICGLAERTNIVDAIARKYHTVDLWYGSLVMKIALVLWSKNGIYALHKSNKFY